MLSDSDDEYQDEELHKLAINEHYAKAFQYRKEREELDKLKAKLGSDISESDIEEEETDSESAESEDEDGEELTPAVDAAILRTLARIRRKDPSIYESGKEIFEEEQEDLAAKAAFTTTGKNKKKDATKPVKLRQVALEAQLNPSRSPSPQPLTHIQEQAALRKETISAFHTATEGANDEEDGLLVLREKTKDEQEQEEAEYRAFLEREVGDLKDIIGVEGNYNDEPVNGSVKRKTNKKKGKEADNVESSSKKRRSKEEEDQEFLVNYILNRGWIDKSKDRIPTYKEITTNSKPKKHKSSQPDSDSEHPSQSNLQPLEQDDEGANYSDSSFDSLVDTFETSYNFRFEEPNSSMISSFPRSIPSLVRREDTKRKDARERRKKRKEEEMETKREEVRRLKALKMREVRRKLEIIGREGGIIGQKSAQKENHKGVHWEDDGADAEGGDMDNALRELDLDGDWDPIKHDQQMAGLYGGSGEGDDDWEDAGEVDEEGKPIWKDDIDIDDLNVPRDVEEDTDIDDLNIPREVEEDIDTGSVAHKKDKKKKKKKKKKNEGLDYDDAGVDDDDMGADVQEEMGEEEEWDGTEEMRKKMLDKYMDEIHNLEFNDMVGGQATHFRFVPVAPQNYALTPVEILLATDKELNEFMSIKRYAPYKNDARKWDANRQKRLRELRSTLAERSKNGGWLQKNSSKTDGATGRRSEDEPKPKKRKGKKERLREKAAAEADNDGSDAGTRPSSATRREDTKMLIGEAEVEQVGVSVDRKKTKKTRKSTSLDGAKEPEDLSMQGHKRKRVKADGETQEPLHQENKDMNEEETGKPKKKRRRKHKKSVGEEP